MDVLLSVVQVLLALMSLAGGAYKVFMYDQIAKMQFGGALPRGGWAALGVFEIVCGVLLVIPAAKRHLTPIAAAGLAVENIALAVFYGRYSLEVTPANPLVWVVVAAVMALFIAVGRFALQSRST
jgi:uncharacterized membrane protein YphA (DoxX/SURF4 family)